MKNTALKIIAIVLITGILAFIDMPGEKQKQILPFLPETVTNTKINLGLDLQGGSQLDYKIDLRNVPEDDQESIVEGVRAVIEKRVNGLGVAEPNIYISQVADETHIIVELSETTALTQEDVDQYLGETKSLNELTDEEIKAVSLEKAKAVVGKTIQLEFKKAKENPEAEEGDEENARVMAEAGLERIKNGEEFEIVGREEEQAHPGKVRFETSDFTFASDLGTVAEKLDKLEAGQYSDEIVDQTPHFSIDSSGVMTQETSIGLIKLLDSREEIKNETEIEVSHILIAYKGAERADATITRNKAEALELAQEIRDRLIKAEDLNTAFEEAAKENSNDASNKEEGGKLQAPVTGDGAYAFDFEEASLAFKKAGELSDVIETPLGYHIIKSDDIRKNVSEKQYRYQSINYSTTIDPWESTGLTGEHFSRADFQLNQLGQPYVSIQFNSEGADLFEQLTEENIGKQIAIFVGGELISAPRVNQAIAGGSAQITGNFTADSARALARDLNTGAIPAPIVLTGEYTIGATLGQTALNQSLEAGVYGLLLVMAFMILYYRLAGIIASIALGVYSVILIFLIKSQLHIGLALALSLLIFGFIILKVITNRDSGPERFISFLLACAAFLFITFLLSTGVVLTLAGTAGLILSIGMAVDANILIFERFKEELRKGKTFRTALDVGFSRAWTSIRDSNFSTLITCAILFYFGSSIIKGFAFNLAAGVLVSMFTAITITRTLLQGFIGKKIAESPLMFGVKKLVDNKKNLNIIGHSKGFVFTSITLIIVSVVAIFSFGLKLGIDFTGGSLMELQFQEEVSKDKIVNALEESETAIKSGNIELNNTAEEVSTDEVGTDEIELAEESKESDSVITSLPDSTEIDLKSAQVVSAGENKFIIKTKELDPVTHDTLIKVLHDKLPEFTEPRFVSIGPVVGNTLFKDAIAAIVIAIIAIVLYVAFAFRRVSRAVSKWKFGACAIFALVHDVLVVTGIFVILGQFFNVEIDSLFITAMLTVLGYSVNDTIVVFDRLRENLMNTRGTDDIESTANSALNETLARSINTSFSTLIALVTILFLGSPNIFYFILALTAGIFVGTYSSIFTATPLLVLWKKSSDKNK